jgi:hypothetical protein
MQGAQLGSSLDGTLHVVQPRHGCDRRTRHRRCRDHPSAATGSYPGRGGADHPGVLDARCGPSVKVVMSSARKGVTDPSRSRADRLQTLVER